MPTSLPPVELIESRKVTAFLQILEEIDFGDRFLLSMLHWCGIGHRSTPLDFWQVFLVQHAGETVGVAGLYRQMGMDAGDVWLGWFAIRPAFRRKGLGAAAIGRVVPFARGIGARRLWVYTGGSDTVAVEFYRSLGFELLGPAGDHAPGLTMADSDIVLRLSL